MLQNRNATLHTTALAHDLFLKLRSHSAADGGAHPMNLAARAMRQDWNRIAQLQAAVVRVRAEGARSFSQKPPRGAEP